MKKCCKFIRFALIALLQMVLWMASPVLAERDRYVFMDEPVAPYVFGVEGGFCEGGITKEIFDELFDRLGLVYEIRLVPWARAIHGVKNGSADGIPLLMQSKDRMSFMVFSDQVIENRDLLYFVENWNVDFEFNDFGQLSKYNVGLVREYTYDESLLQAIKDHGIKITYSTDSDANLRMLHAGHVDMVVEDETTAAQILAMHPGWARRIVAAPKAISKYYWYIGIGRHSPLAKRLGDINRALDSMRADGSLEAIVSKRSFKRSMRH